MEFQLKMKTHTETKDQIIRYEWRKSHG